MTSKADWKADWMKAGVTPEERRTRLNELGALVEKDDEQWREHNALAELVADDEDEALRVESGQDEE
jgi:hypothetical protein